MNPHPPSADIYELYCAEALGHPILTKEQENDLLQRAAAGDLAARNQLVAANQRLVVHVASRYWRAGASGDQHWLDLVGWGNIGLIEAISRWQPDHTARFSTYAVYWIRSYIRRRGLPGGDTLRRTARQGEMLHQIRRANAILSASLHRSPDPREIAAFIGVTPALVEGMLPLLRKTISIENAVTPGGSLQISDTLTAPERTEASAEVRLLAGQMHAAIDQLPPQYALVIAWRYGLDHSDPLTQSAIAKRLGITRQRVGEIEANAMNKLRKIMTGQMPGQQE